MLESESNKDTEDDKYNRVDMLVRDSKGEIIIIEIQNNREWDFVTRILYGTSKVITEQMEKGMKYKQVKKVISISIVYFDLGHGKDYIYHGKTKFIGMHENDELELNKKEKSLYKKEKIDDIYPEYYIIKVNQFNDLAKNTLDEWIYTLKNSEVKDNFTAKGLKEAKEKLDIMKLSEKERKIYNRYLENIRYEASTLGLERELGKIEGREEGREEGLEKGRAEKKANQLETAKKLLKKGMLVSEIAEVTGLTCEEIEKLKKF